VVHNQQQNSRPLAIVVHGGPPQRTARQVERAVQDGLKVCDIAIHHFKPDNRG
jgi:hypothetical protein